MKFPVAVVVLFLTTHSHSQQLNQVTFSSGANLSAFSFLTDQGVLIRISGDGNVIEWGTEVRAQRYNYYSPKLQPYPGRVVYYGAESDSVSNGKVKSIGTCVLTYYGSYERDSKVGKVKSIGTTPLDYYTSFDNTAFQGKLKSIGNFMLEYYSSFDDEASRGKLKSVSNTPITYYSTFDDKLIKGKIKSIGSTTYAWYTSRDRREYQGGLKSGNYRQDINGVTYILR